MLKASPGVARRFIVFLGIAAGVAIIWALARVFASTYSVYRRVHYYGLPPSPRPDYGDYYPEDYERFLEPGVFVYSHLQLILILGTVLIITVIALLIIRPVRKRVPQNSAPLPQVQPDSAARSLPKYSIRTFVPYNLNAGKPTRPQDKPRPRDK